MQRIPSGPVRRFGLWELFRPEKHGQKGIPAVVASPAEAVHKREQRSSALVTGSNLFAMRSICIDSWDGFSRPGAACRHPNPCSDAVDGSDRLMAGQPPDDPYQPARL